MRGLRKVLRVYAAVKPQSMDSTAPVVEAAPSEQSHSAPEAISGGVLCGPNGELRPPPAMSWPAEETMRRAMSVLTAAGQTALMRARWPLYCNAALRVKPSTPCLDAE